MLQCSSGLAFPSSTAGLPAPWGCFSTTWLQQYPADVTFHTLK